MLQALQTLSGVLADPADPGAAAALDALRARWGALAPEERKALTPLARLAAERVAAAAPPVLASAAPRTLAVDPPAGVPAGGGRRRLTDCALEDLLALL